MINKLKNYSKFLFLTFFVLFAATVGFAQNPKLVIKNVTGPNSAKPGEEITLQVTVKNEGQAAFEFGQDYLQLYQANNQSCAKGPCDIFATPLSTNIVFIPALGIGEEKTITATFSIVSNFIIGNYKEFYDFENYSKGETSIGLKSGRYEWYARPADLFLYNIRPIYPTSDIAITATTEQKTIDANGKWRTKVQVRNKGPQTAQYINIYLNLTLPTFNEFLPQAMNITKGEIYTHFFYSYGYGPYQVIWNIPSLNVNETASVDLEYTLLPLANYPTYILPDTIGFSAYHVSKVIDNATENDKVSLKFTKYVAPKPDLTISNLNLGATSIEQGKILTFKFDLKNIGNATATGDFNIKSYLSKDNVLSDDDIQDGIIPTGNIAAGQTISQVQGALTVPSSLAAGQYYVILKVDADNNISESKEDNNMVISSTTISITRTETTPICNKEIATGSILCVNQLADYSNELFIANQNEIQKITVDKNGTITNSVPYVAPMRDSILVKDNFIIKKLSNGTIAFQKEITKNILNRFSAIQIIKAIQLDDGSFILGGINRSDKTGYDSLYIIKADANLNFIKSITKKGLYINSNNVILNETLAFFITQDKQLVVLNGIKTNTSGEAVFYYQLNDNLALIKQDSFYTTNMSYYETPCNTILLSAFYFSGGGKSGTNSYRNIELDLNDFSVKSERSSIQDGNYYTSFDGYSRARYSNSDTIKVSGQHYSDSRYNVRGSSSSVQINKDISNFSYTDFTDILRTGEATVALITKKDEKLYFHSADCFINWLNIAAAPTTYKQWNYNQITVTVENKDTKAADFSVKLNMNVLQAVIAAEKPTSISNGNFDSSNQVWNIGSLDSGAKATFSFYVFVKVADGDVKIKANLTKPSIVASTVTLIPATIQPDLALAFTPLSVTPDQWTNFSTTLTLKNNSTTAQNNVIVKIPKPAGVVYQGGKEYNTTQGTFNTWSTHEWYVGTLAAGASATLMLNYFRTTKDAFSIIATSGTATATLNIGIAARSAGVLEENAAFSIYPNPAYSDLTLDLSDYKNATVDVMIYDALGRLIFQKNIEQIVDNQYIIPINHWNSGQYFVLLQSEGRLSASKAFVVIRD